ncbi:glycoside hydrolase family 10 protein [Actinomadura oligospora]|uniref:glycoside hydrolase family 10 protein n=1 Tax=Actinomadura oligospora TaxID=111804 RepID=UPI0004B5C187|nr:family 10 glycosylhydrolase [Actinomadura oligospora]
MTSVTGAALALATATGCMSAFGGTRKDTADAVRAECAAIAAPGDSRSRQLRAMWIATVGGTDWPTDPSKPAAEQRKRFTRLLDTARAMNLNAAVVQIRPDADAFYRSPYEPWSAVLTGTPGKDPGYDVLAFMIKEAHARNLEFHAWFNPYRVAQDKDRSKLAPNSPARKHPDWVRAYGDQLWYDPGLPQVRDLATNAVMDVVNKYDIDAVHFDDYFYPYPESGDFPDAATYRASGHGMAKADWRRRNVDTLVQTLSGKIHQAKPWVRFGISPFGVWRNKTTDPAGSATKALQSYDDIYADTRGWIRKRWIDYVTPQLYWPIGDRAADYRTLVGWWSRQVAGSGVQLSIGQAGYRVGEDATWRKTGELSRHLTLNARHPEVRGDIFFSASDIARNQRGFAARVRADHYKRPAIPPAAPPKAQKAAVPAPVHDVRAATADRGRGVQISWAPAGTGDGAGRTVAYAIYRRDGRGAGCAAVDPAALIGTVRDPGTPAGARLTLTDTSARPGRDYTYTVTALDRVHRESPPARAATVTVNRG